MSALTLRADVQFLRADDGEGEALTTPRTPRFAMVGYTGGIIRQSWSREPIVIDLAGMSVPSVVLPGGVSSAAAAPRSAWPVPATSPTVGLSLSTPSSGWRRSSPGMQSTSRPKGGGPARRGIPLPVALRTPSGVEIRRKRSQTESSRRPTHERTHAPGRCAIPPG